MFQPGTWNNFRGAVSFSTTTKGHSPAYLETMGCTKTSASIIACPKFAPGIKKCDHTKAASVVCVSHQKQQIQNNQNQQKKKIPKLSQQVVQQITKNAG